MARTRSHHPGKRQCLRLFAGVDKNELISLFTQAMDYRFTGSVRVIQGQGSYVKFILSGGVAP